MRSILKAIFYDSFRLNRLSDSEFVEHIRQNQQRERAFKWTVCIAVFCLGVIIAGFFAYDLYLTPKADEVLGALKIDPVPGPRAVAWCKIAFDGGLALGFVITVFALPPLVAGLHGMFVVIGYQQRQAKLLVEFHDRLRATTPPPTKDAA